MLVWVVAVAIMNLQNAGIIAILAQHTTMTRQTVKNATLAIQLKRTAKKETIASWQRGCFGPSLFSAVWD